MEAIEIKPNQIPKLKFSRRDVLSTKGSRTNRFLKIKSLSIKTQLDKIPITIHFKSKKRGVFVTKTNAIMADSKYVTLQGGEKIPANSIYQLKPL